MFRGLGFRGLGFRGQGTYWGLVGNNGLCYRVLCSGFWAGLGGNKGKNRDYMGIMSPYQPLIFRLKDSG